MSLKNLNNILLIDKSDLHSELVDDAFSRINNPVNLGMASTTADVFKKLKEQTWQCILLAIDEIPLSIPDFIEQIPQNNQSTPIIILQSEYNRSDALTYLSQGIYDVIAFNELDYLTLSFKKGLQTEELSLTLKSQREAIKDAHDRFRALTTQLPMAIAFIHEGAFINVNPEFQRFFAIKSSDSLAEISFLDLVDAKEVPKMRQAFKEFNQSEEVDHIKLENVTLKNLAEEKCCADLSFTRTNINQESGLQIIIQPHVEEPEQEIEPIEEDTSQLLSPEFFIQKLNQNIRNKNNEINHALCFLEVDDYTKYKKRLGITRNDFLFQKISEYITNLNNSNIEISQFNIDVYTVLINADSTEKCEELAQQLQDMIVNHSFVVDDYTVHAAVNLGLVHINDQIQNPDQAFSLADVACTVSRNKNQHEIHVYSQKEDRSTVETVDFSWKGRIEDALKNDNFRLVFQPILHIKNNPTPMYEVLLRMKSSHGKDILPGQFLHAAKQSEQELTIDQWVVTHTLKLLNESADADTCLFVKLSAASLKSMDFIKWLKEQCGVRSSQLVFEIAEHVALEFESEILHFIQEIKKIGCKVCLEHFGNHPDASDELTALGSDYYKIDGAFINHLATNRKHQAIIRNIVRNTAINDAYIIACFVQDADSLAILWREGVDYIQGNYLQIPNSQLSYKFEAQI